MSQLAEKAGRRQHLRTYLLGCLSDSILTWDDLASLSVGGRLISVFYGDMQLVVRDLLKEGGGNVLQFIGSQLQQFGQKLAAKRSPK